MKTKKSFMTPKTFKVGTMAGDLNFIISVIPIVFLRAKDADDEDALKRALSTELEDECRSLDHYNKCMMTVIIMK